MHVGRVVSPDAESPEDLLQNASSLEEPDGVLKDSGDRMQEAVVGRNGVRNGCRGCAGAGIDGLDGAMHGLVAVLVAIRGTSDVPQETGRRGGLLHGLLVSVGKVVDQCRQLPSRESAAIVQGIIVTGSFP